MEKNLRLMERFGTDMPEMEDICKECGNPFGKHYALNGNCPPENFEELVRQTLDEANRFYYANHMLPKN